MQHPTVGISGSSTPVMPYETGRLPPCRKAAPQVLSLILPFLRLCSRGSPSFRCGARGVRLRTGQRNRRRASPTASSLEMKRAGKTMMLALLWRRMSDAISGSQAAGADALVLVEGHRHPFARAAEGDAAFQFAVFDRLGQRMREVCIVDAVGRMRAEIEHLVTHGVEVTYQEFFHFIACVVAGNTYFIHRILVLYRIRFLFYKYKEK